MGLLLIIAGVIIYVKCRKELDDNEDFSAIEIEKVITYTTLQEAEEKILDISKTSDYLVGQNLENLILNNSQTIDYLFVKLPESGY